MLQILCTLTILSTCRFMAIKSPLEIWDSHRKNGKHHVRPDHTQEQMVRSLQPDPVFPVVSLHHAFTLEKGFRDWVFVREGLFLDDFS